MSDLTRAQARLHGKAPIFGTNTTVGRFHYGAVQDGRLQVLATWRVTSDHGDLIERVAELLGGMPQSEGEHWVITETSSVNIVLSGPVALRALWFHDQAGTCDGNRRVSAMGAVPCTCPAELSERKDAARKGHGCAPQIQLLFQLQRDPSLGIFVFRSGNWPFAEDAALIRSTLRGSTRPAVAQLRLDHDAHTLRCGRQIEYTRPTLKLLHGGHRPPRHRGAHPIPRQSRRHSRPEPKCTCKKDGIYK